MKTYTQVLTLAIGLALAGSAGAATAVAEDPAAATDELIAARQEFAELRKRMAELSAKLGSNEAHVRMFRTIGDPDRAVIGVILGESDKTGVRIEGVTPGGAADRAGLRAGDLITVIRGRSVSGDRPVKALRDALADLKVGDEVTLAYIRGDKAFDGKINAEAQGLLSGFSNPMQVFSDNGDGRDFDFERLAPDTDHRIERVVTAAGEHGTIHFAGGQGNFNMMALASVSGLRLTAMNPDLGRYFGVDSGALVLEVESDEYQGLQAADVILEVDGKAVADPRETLRALRKFEPDSKVELKLQRDRVPQLVKVSVPEKSRAFLMPPPPPAPPTPPAPPAAPRAPAPPQPPMAAAPQPPVPPGPPPRRRISI